MTEQKTRRDFDGLSERRREAMALLDEGVSQTDIARELEVSRQTVSRWARLKDEFPDDEAWRRRPLGRPGGLTDEQKEAIGKILADNYVREFGTEDAVRWTLARVAGMIKSAFGVTCSLMYVRGILMDFVDDSRQCPRFSSRFWTRMIERAYPELAGRVRVHVPAPYRSDRAVVLGVRQRLLALFGCTV